jgi:hypothetical protein
LRSGENASLQAARARWVERMRLAKQRGSIAKFPNGRKSGVRGRSRSANKTIARARRVQEEGKMARTNLPAAVVAEESAPVPWGRKPKNERLADLVDQSLEQTRRILGIEFDPEDRSPAGIKLVSVIATTALAVIAQQAKLDEAALRAQTPGFDYDTFYQRFGTEDEGDGKA